MMKTNKEPLRAAMDRRLSFLDDLPSCRAALHSRIAQEAPVMKKKLSVGLVFALVLVLLTAAALAAGLLLSPRVSAARTADLALKEQFGVTEEMQTFFTRNEAGQPDGSVIVTYTGAGSLEYVLGTYTAVVKNNKAEITWSREGEDTSGGYEADCWGLDQLKQMMADGAKEDKAFLEKAEKIAAKHLSAELSPLPEAEDDFFEKKEAAKTAAMSARKLSEEEMIAIGREFILTNYNLNEEQIARMELYTNSIGEQQPNTWYEMINDAPCFQVEYLLYEEYPRELIDAGEPRPRTEMDGYYNVFVNVETGVVESFEYNSALNGLG